MRVLMWFTIGFAAACIVGAYLLSGSILFWLALGCLIFCVGAAVLGRSRNRCRIAAVLLAGLAAGFGWFLGYDHIYLGDARAMDGQILTLTIRTTDYSYTTDYGIAADGKVTLDGRDYRLRAYINDTQTLPPGSTVSGLFRLRYTADGGQDDPTYHRGEGIFLLAYPEEGSEITPALQHSWRYMPAYLRQWVLDAIRAIFPEDTAAFACALLLGDSTGLDYETDTAFKLSGIRHVIAVSGLHVSILFSLIYWLTSRRRFLSAILGIPVLFMFAAMAGFTPSIVRACLMQLLMLLSAVLLKEYDPPTGLAFAVLCMLVVNPQTVTSVGFQLSVASVAGIFLFGERLRVWILARLGMPKGKWGKYVGGFASSVAISLSAMVFTTPLTAFYFGTVSLIGPVTNLLTLWVISFIFCGIIVACIFAAVFMPVGQAVAWVIAWPIRYVITAAQWLGGLPVASVYTESVYIVAWLVLCYVLLIVFMAGVRKRPGFLTCCMAVGLCAALLASWLEPLQSSWRMTVLDVGQGQCILLQSGGRTFMVDCGGSDDETVADLAAATLLSQGITRLDGLILTHYDRDHVGGAAYLLTRVDVDTVYLPYLEDVENAAPELAQIAGIHVTQDMQLEWEDTSLMLFAPTDGKTDNETSLCVLFQTEKCDILITGDRDTRSEVALLLNENLPDLEILVAGHHGADPSTSEFLLRATSPETVVISVEKDNRYGHPSQILLDRLDEHGCTVRRTDKEGTVILWG